MGVLDHCGGGAEQGARPLVDEVRANGGNCVRLDGPALAEQQQVAAVLDPVVTGGEGQEVRFADAGGGVEIEGGEGLACGQAGLVEMALDAQGRASSHLGLKEKKGKTTGGERVSRKR